MKRQYTAPTVKLVHQNKALPIDILYLLRFNQYHSLTVMYPPKHKFVIPALRQ